MVLHLPFSWLTDLAFHDCSFITLTIGAKYIQYHFNLHLSLTFLLPVHSTPMHKLYDLRWNPERLHGPPASHAAYSRPDLLSSRCKRGSRLHVRYRDCSRSSGLDMAQMHMLSHRPCRVMRIVFPPTAGSNSSNEAAQSRLLALRLRYLLLLVLPGGLANLDPATMSSPATQSCIRFLLDAGACFLAVGRILVLDHHRRGTRYHPHWRLLVR
jgi:hypothetical protein